MTYQDLPLESGGTVSSPTVGGALATRSCGENPDHHLWNNRGTWWCHFTWHRADYTAERIRVSLKTPDLAEARVRRDELLRNLAR